MGGAMQDFQERGEPYRAKLGIDGTAADAQDVPHEFHVDGEFPAPGRWCMVCGLNAVARVHDPALLRPMVRRS